MVAGGEGQVNEASGYSVRDYSSLSWIYMTEALMSTAFLPGISSAPSKGGCSLVAAGGAALQYRARAAPILRARWPGTGPAASICTLTNPAWCDRMCVLGAAVHQRRHLRGARFSRLPATPVHGVHPSRIRSPQLQAAVFGIAHGHQGVRSCLAIAQWPACRSCRNSIGPYS
jgi:hypothetical protein